jgi:hypothetical protein
MDPPEVLEDELLLPVFTDPVILFTTFALHVEEIRIPGLGVGVGVGEGVLVGVGVGVLVGVGVAVGVAVGVGDGGRVNSTSTQ